MTGLGGLVRSFATLLRPESANEARLGDWAGAARACELPNVHAFTCGVDLDIDAAIATVTLPFHNDSADATHRHSRKRDRAVEITVPHLTGRSGVGIRKVGRVGDVDLRDG